MNHWHQQVHKHLIFRKLSLCVAFVLYYLPFHQTGLANIQAVTNKSDIKKMGRQACERYTGFYFTETVYP